MTRVYRQADTYRSRPGTLHGHPEWLRHFDSRLEKNFPSAPHFSSQPTAAIRSSQGSHPRLCFIGLVPGPMMKERAQPGWSKTTSSGQTIRIPPAPKLVPSSMCIISWWRTRRRPAMRQLVNGRTRLTGTIFMMRRRRVKICLIDWVCQALPSEADLHQPSSKSCNKLPGRGHGPGHAKKGAWKLRTHGRQKGLCGETLRVLNRYLPSVHPERQGNHIAEQKWCITIYSYIRFE